MNKKYEGVEELEHVLKFIPDMEKIRMETSKREREIQDEASNRELRQILTCLLFFFGAPIVISILFTILLYSFYALFC